MKNYSGAWGKREILPAEYFKEFIRIDFEGYPLSAETIKKIGYECGMLCHGTSLDPEGVLDDIIRKVGDAL